MASLTPVTARTLAFAELKERGCQRVLVVGFEEPTDLACAAEATAPGGLAVGLDLGREGVADVATEAKGLSAGAVVAAPTILPFGPARFDAVLTTYSPRLLPEMLAAFFLKGVNRILAPDGTLVLIHRSRRWPAVDEDGKARAGRVLPDGLTEAALEAAGFGDLAWREAPSPFILTGIVVARRSEE